MKVLLDTQAFFWFLDDDPRLTRTAKSIIVSSSNQVLLSIASSWEIAIKVSTAKFELYAEVDEFFSTQTARNNITLLGIELAHLNAVAKLPFHHRDPFDRMIIAQAMVEDIPIVGSDTAFDDYAICRLWT